ncbi:hypothetical protein XA68_13748 [Ophiocordyceps unilateralis]|uniref:Urea transporter n=1 Tax=Ophiocordyceps unilateralis TaxID=268505 RepID=A0A2A9PB00_OPHUN|nr:hypothetical protein XA68_13748 [Ophiocordyceps unilateralis]
MGQPSVVASNAIIYTTYAAFLVLGTAVGWRMRGRARSTGELLSSNGSKSALPLALNFIASALGAGILFSYPEMATVTGVQGVVVYAAATALPLLAFGAIGPVIRRRCPTGFVLTEWTRQRYGQGTMLYLSLLTLATLFLYMVAELSALGQVVEALTGTGKLGVMVAECVVTTVYTSLGGFQVSFFTDVIQGALVLALVLLSAISVGVRTNAVKPGLVSSSGLTSPSLLGWQLLYVLPMAVTTNAFFVSSFWLRTFASRTDFDLRLGSCLAAVVVGCVLAAVGSAGLIAVWSGAWPGEPKREASLALFALLERLPVWVVCVVVVMVVCLSTAALDSLQSAMVSSASNDLFGNSLAPRYVRGMVFIVIVPVIVVALKAVSILQVYLVSDLLSAATVPVLCLGLIDRMHWWRGFEVVAGGIGGILSVFLFGLVYHGNAVDGARLLILHRGLYADDWSVFGAFVAAPLGGLVVAFAALALRLAFLFLRAKQRGERFDALDGPCDAGRVPGRQVHVTSGNDRPDTVDVKAGKFF